MKKMNKDKSKEIRRRFRVNLSNNCVSRSLRRSLSKFKRARKEDACSLEREKSNTDGDPFEVAGEQLSRGPLRFDDDDDIERSIDRLDIP